MAYIALYRKYRPQVFSDIVGQETVTTILKNQIKSNKISHAYIFSGCRGTGKTSAAKVFARAINCLNPVGGEPCNECEICKKILDGTTTDVVEMDAASNNSVENIRQIRQEVVYSTVDAKYRVYIIDEAHMLTTSAFNALLKTLEEPPENVVFILATTEQHKIPVTILSRCLKFEFNKLSKENISSRLKYVLEQEKIKYEDEAIDYISYLADGALRDALSILDRCKNEYTDVLKYQDVLKIVGGIDKKVINEISENIIKENLDEVLKKLDEITSQGKDIKRLVSSINEKMLEILINTSDSNEKNKIVSIINKLSKLENDMKYAMNPEILIKSCFVEICSFAIISENSNSISNDEIKRILSKVSALEQKINELEKRPSVIGKELPRESKVKVVSNIDTSNICDEYSNLEELKKELAKMGKLKIYSAITSSKVYEKDNLLVIISSNKLAYEILMNEENLAYISSIINTLSNKEYLIKVELKENGEDELTLIEKVFNENGITYTKID